jgi:hypothetical protein
VPLREHKGAVIAVAVGVVAVAVHLLLGTAAVLAASRWLDGIAIALALAFVVVLHVTGLRRLAARRAQPAESRRDAG